MTLRELLATWAVHDLDHVSQIFAGMAGSHDVEVGPSKAYLGILLRREDRPPSPGDRRGLFLAALFVAALLYSSIGHAGASAYLAAMALVGVPVAIMRPTALVLNVFVASIVVVRFSLARHLPWRSLVPLAIGSVPAAFVGGSIELPERGLPAAGRGRARRRAWRLAASPAPVDDARRPACPGSPVSSAAPRLACWPD